MTKQYKPTPESCAERLKDHQYTLLAKTGNLEAWRAQKPGSSADGFDLVMSRYGTAMFGDTGCLVWDVAGSYGLEFLARGDEHAAFMKLDESCREKDLDEENLVMIVFDAIYHLLFTRNTPGQPDWLPDTAPDAERIQQLDDWLIGTPCKDGEYGALVVALREVQNLEVNSIESARLWLDDHQELLELSGDEGEEIEKPTDSVMQRIYFAQHAAEQILAQKELSDAVKRGGELMTEAEKSHLEAICEDARQEASSGLYAVQMLETGEYLGFASEDQADMHVSVLNMSAQGYVAKVVPSPWTAVEHWKAVAQRLQASLTSQGKESIQRMHEHAEEIAVRNVELMHARGFIVAAHAWENNKAAIETVAGIDKVLSSPRVLALMERAKPVEYAYGPKEHCDDWSNDSLASYVSDRELVAGTVIYRGTTHHATPSSFLPDIDDVINHMANQAYDNSEYADNFPDLTKEQQDELESLMEPMRAWVDRHCDVKFYEVRDIEPYTVTAEDVAAAKAYRLQLEVQP